MDITRYQGIYLAIKPYRTTYNSPIAWRIRQQIDALMVRVGDMVGVVERPVSIDNTRLWRLSVFSSAQKSFNQYLQ